MPASHRPIETLTSFVATFGHAPVRRTDALAAGFTRGRLDAAVRRGLLTSPRYGLLQATTTAPGELPWRVDAGARMRAVHLADIRATLLSVQDDVLVAGDSAALVHGLARPGSALPSYVQLIRPDGSGYGGALTRRRGSPVPEFHRTVVDGVPVTCVERTAVDLARGRPLAAALIPLDSAARLIVARETGATSNQLRACVQVRDLQRFAVRTLESALLTCKGWAGTVRVREALHHVHPASESAHESRSRAWFIAAGLGPLNPGTPIDCGSTTYWADFCDPETRVIGEADGWSKYGQTAQEVRAALDRERGRAADLEHDGWLIVRWSTAASQREVVSRMTRALRARRR